jgi:hypothetical protein
MPQRKTESRFLKRTGTRASSIGVGSGGKQSDELRALGVSTRALTLLDECIAKGWSFDRALNHSIMVSDLCFYHSIDRLDGVPSNWSFSKKLYEYFDRQHRQRRAEHRKALLAFKAKRLTRQCRKLRPGSGA